MRCVTEKYCIDSVGVAFQEALKYILSSSEDIKSVIESPFLIYARGNINNGVFKKIYEIACKNKIPYNEFATYNCLVDKYMGFLKQIIYRK